MNRNFGKLENGAIQYAPNNVRIGDTIFAAPTAEQYATAGYLAIEDTAPTATDGYYANPTGWTQKDGKIVREYELVAIPAAVRKFSKLKIYGAIAQLGAWDKIQSWFEGKSVNGVNGWLAFQLCQEISEDHELFAAMADEARELLGMTEDAFDAMLDECVLEG